MKTVFDLVGKFSRLNPKTHQITQETKILVASLVPSQACVGKTVLEYAAHEKAKEHIVPGKYWFNDWDLIERHVA